MSHAQEPSAIDDSELAASQTPGYRPGQAKTLEELNALDAEDESLKKYKQALLGGAGAGAGGSGGKPGVSLVALRLSSPGLQQPIVLDLSNPAKLAESKQNSLTIKEGAEYAVELEFRVTGGIISGLKYIQVAKRAGITADKVEEMIGSYGPSDKPVTKKFAAGEAPSGMLARGTYTVRSRCVDDDQTVHADFSWQFKIAKDWA